ncbi:ABC efflux pump, inner membrane subunit [Candidatus Koribacter versatilis Ellin345]|uniref:ABC efflux pump, inner membrane subunit n=1 Tax=Koribacter versatilis (strain Ellin345) TaxID=204669 RepID=Q1IUS4_KORVE|nr:ABC transporter permease [Candidatus Koribacter versatilis]ABF39376.1 ABC efflux pump, inner membrane subunit [Candidatus Koribacter versatilis Ellin345]
MTTLMQDVRYAFRQLYKKPGFSFTAVFTIALAIGVATAVFSVLYAILIRPLPFDQPDKIFFLQGYSPQGYTQPAAYPEYLHWRRNTQSFSALAGYSRGSANFETNGGPVPITSVSTTDNFFQVFGVNPILGRTFADGEDQPGKNDVVVLSYESWQQDFGGRQDVTGATAKIDGRPYSIIGVMPAGFRYPISAAHAVYLPLHIPKDLAESKGSHWMPMVARLKNGVTSKQAEDDMGRAMESYAVENPDAKGRRMNIEGIAAHVVGDTGAPLKVLLFAVLAVLGIGCANFAGLLLARGVKREREVAVRSAIGATRTRLVRQMLTETVMLAIAGTLGGVLLAFLLLSGITKLLIAALARGADVQINIPVLVASLAVAIITALVAGVVPALRLSSIAPSLALKAGGSAGSARGQHHLRAVFIVTQIALALVLLVTSGLLMRTLAGLRSTDLGFTTNNMIATELDLSRGAYENRDVVTEFYNPLMEKVQAIPGVKAAGMIQIIPIQNWGWNSDVQIVGKPPAPKGQEQLAEYRVVTPGYYSAMGIRLLRGRLIDPKLDNRNTKPVTVVNEAFVKKFFAPGEDPVGQHLSDDDKTEIVGVVSDVRQNIYAPPLAEMDYAVSQVSAKNAFGYLSSMQLVVRTSMDPAGMMGSLRNALHEVDPGVPSRTPETMKDVIAEVLIFERLENWLFGTFAALAILLSIVGLYGLISHEVDLSIRDIGVRMALGATRAQVLAGVYKRVGLLLAIGVAGGLIMTMAVQKILSALVVLHLGKDAVTIVSLAAGLALFGLLAALLPARRAASTEPMTALRYE